MPSRTIRRFRTVGLLTALALGVVASTTSAGQAVAAGHGSAVHGAGQRPAAGHNSAAHAAAQRSRPRASTSFGSTHARHASCPHPGHGSFRCLSYWHGMSRSGVTSARAGAGAAVAAPKEGLTPANIQAAYKLPKTGGQGQTIAVVDAYDDPHLETDLKAYRSAFKLPACTTANGCFRKVDQRGGKKYPDGDPDWAVETSLDVEAVSAACPGCSILVVEGDDDSFAALGKAENTAVTLGASAVSNSYGADEFNGMIALGKKYYTHPGVPIVASSGDYGFTAASFPAVLKTTWAIGGTELSPTKKGGWSEAAWDGSGSGCSAWITKPAAQTDTNCDMRTVSDISAVADSEEGFAVYDTYGLGADDGWIGVGGTSLSSPLIAAMIGLAGNSVSAARPSYAYAHRSGLKDVVGGSNGYCGDDYLCTGVKGYDAPTGLGSPRGLKSL